MQQDVGSISIFFYEGNIGVSPTIINLSKILEEHGYLVTIYAKKSDDSQPGEIGNVKILYFETNKLIQFISKNKKLDNVVRLFDFSGEVLFKEIQNLRNKSNQKNINIGVDIYGLIVALLCFYFLKQKFFVLSLELYKPPKSLIKIVSLAFRKAEGVIIQDEDRLKTLCRFYEYQHPQVFYLPNSPLPFDDKNLTQVTENYFREKFNLSQEKFPYIISQAGMIRDKVFSKSLAKAFTSIDNGCALILHASKRKNEEDPYIKSLRQVNSKNLFLSLDPLPYDQIDKIYASTTIGLAFYEGEDDDNFSKISMASGKLSHYLKYGKPVLVNDLPSLSSLVEKYEFGLVIKEPSDSQEIKSAIDQIISDYEKYSNNAKACFEAEFDFYKKMEPILSCMESL
jgi:glycosyltransferase involved in cell wall biosynthesis